MSKPLKVQIVERARVSSQMRSIGVEVSLPGDPKCRGICPLSDSATKRCGLGALITAAYEVTSGHPSAYDLAIRAMQPLYGIAPHWSKSMTCVSYRPALPSLEKLDASFRHPETAQVAFSDFANDLHVL